MPADQIAAISERSTCVDFSMISAVCFLSSWISRPSLRDRVSKKTRSCFRWSMDVRYCPLYVKLLLYSRRAYILHEPIQHTYSHTHTHTHTHTRIHKPYRFKSVFEGLHLTASKSTLWASLFASIADFDFQSYRLTFQFSKMLLLRFDFGLKTFE